MMNFNAPYNRENLVDFLQYQFLPSDYQPNEQDMGYAGGKSAKILSITELGYCESLNLHVLEVKHNSSNDARVSIAKEIFSFLRDNAWYNCLVAFVPTDNRDVYRLSFIKQTPKLINNKLDWEHSNPKRYSFLLGVGQHVKTPQTYLANRVSSKEELEECFSVETLTKEFYSELYNWYLWASSDSVNIRYPNNACDPNDDRDYLSEHLIRLITRLMFVWFIKQKSFIPKELFDITALQNNILLDFDPESYTQGNYYNAILQNLFFASLNKKITERKFASGSREYGIKTLFRDNDGKKSSDTWFKMTHDQVLKLFEPVPFLNGGLFECLDKPKECDGDDSCDDKNTKILYFDGFSRDDMSKKRAFIPNAIFFAPEHEVTLPQETKPKMVSGIINIFQKYNFTVEENTPNDVDVALDPELLGKVFENLLAAYNPETGESARKSSGSFYTPREIVDYMVDKSINVYLDTKLGKNYTSEDLKQALFDIKIIDPACGSGAFPMGILNNIFNRLRDIDPALDSYKTKLQLIENCIYGVDIQPIAVQISKLRFFISLICEQKEKNTDPNTNYGIEQLPNLETKFVAANTLIKIKRSKVLSFDDAKIEEVRNRINNVRHLHFNAKTWKEKKEYRDRDKDLRKELLNLLKNNGLDTPELREQAENIAKWDPYNQNSAADFFDNEWMFGIEDGFNIAIGNPPYVQMQKFKLSDEDKKAGKPDMQKKYQQQDYGSYASMGDLYQLFYERGMDLLKKDGFLCYITSNKWLRSGYGETTRKLFSTKYTPKLLLDLGGQVFKSATVDTNILLAQKAVSKNAQTLCWTKPKDIDPENMSVLIEQQGQTMNFTSEPWVILSDIERSIKAKIEKYGTPLRDWDIHIYRGILTGCNEAFIIDEAKKEELIKKDPKSAEIIRPILRGRDIQRNGYEFANLYLICTFPSKHYDINDFPAIKDWLINGDWVLPNSPIGTGQLRLEQTGQEHTVNGKKFKSRKKTNNKWFETQDSISYWDDFNKPKIIYQELSQGSRFAFDPDGVFFVSNTAYLLTGENLDYLLKVLNSKIIEFVFRNYYSTSMGETGLRWLNQYVINLPIPKPTPKSTSVIQNASESEIEQILKEAYCLSDSEMQFISDSVNP